MAIKGRLPKRTARRATVVRKRGMGLEVVDAPGEGAAAFYEAPLALLRCDQVVAWRSFDDADTEAVAAVAIGHGGSSGTMR